MPQYILAIDQGTTSSRSLLFDHDARIVSVAQEEFRQILPAPGQVEHDPEDIWNSQLNTIHGALGKVALDAVAAIGITNQRETTFVWDKRTGNPIHNAIVWQSRVSSYLCDRLRKEGLEETIRQKTGLVLDAYFSATKLMHLLETIDGARRAAEEGHLLFGTVDCYLVWKLTGGKRHVTDASNASRTMMLNFETLDWDDELLAAYNIPRGMLPEIVDCSGKFAETDPAIFGASIPIAGMAGDQQAASFGQTCFDQGMVKNTYGTGAFALMNIGDKPVLSQNNLLTTVGWKIGDQVSYALEGSIFVAGAVVQWLRDGLGIIECSSEVEPLADTVPDNGGVYFVPAFVGLGAPYWDPNARGTIVGLTRGTTGGHLARAALESMAYQTRDMIEAMQRDAGVPLQVLQVDGGASVNNALMQFQTDLLGTTVRRPKVSETTGLGAAFLAGLAVGFWESQEELRGLWNLDKEFMPATDRSKMDQMYARWKEAVERSRNWERAGE
ncbi:glycerol kinase [Blastopirellula marina]|uniref:Glycerol kinase n=1 Tax=Blastopirellula marina TaxID=124 RepID=A0A2S8F199_9BACT|nr:MULTISPECIES: glycerol kinase GlpK [Pirellulaceae]PQO25946.1 glycerol kinase [Blastopirellula marina]RCS44304.1 glycerol kinase [Bremerella cremea]